MWVSHLALPDSESCYFISGSSYLCMYYLAKMDSSKRPVDKFTSLLAYKEPFCTCIVRKVSLISRIWEIHGFYLLFIGLGLTPPPLHFGVSVLGDKLSCSVWSPSIFHLNNSKSGHTGMECRSHFISSSFSGLLNVSLRPLIWTPITHCTCGKRMPITNQYTSSPS